MEGLGFEKVESHDCSFFGACYSALRASGGRQMDVQPKERLGRVEELSAEVR